MKQTGHKTLDMIRRYDRETDITKNNAVSELV